MSTEPTSTSPAAPRAWPPPVAVLAGGVGAARFLEGLVQVVEPDQIAAIVNTGDDAEFYGLHVSPDFDIVLYTLAGLVDEAQGWGVRGDTCGLQEMLARYGQETWFKLGDRDLATHVYRTEMLRQGLSLTQVAARLREALGVRVWLLPMSDEPSRTEIVTPAGTLPFQEYFVKRRQEDEVLAVRLHAGGGVTPTAAVVEAVERAEAILVAPSNPLVSIGPIVGLIGIRERLRLRRDRVVAISPIIGGVAVKGPLARMLETLRYEVSAYGVAALYADMAGTFVIDEVDADLAPRIRDLGMRVVVAPTLMSGAAEKRALAETTLRAAGWPPDRDR